MAKLKKNSRSSRHRKNPIARNGINSSPSAKQDENLSRDKVLPLITKLSSASSNDRSMAIGAISVLAEEQKFRKLLLKEKLLKIVLEQLLSDSNSEIVVEAFGLLRNFVIEEGYDVAVYLWRQGIWKTVEENLNKAKSLFDTLLKEKVSKNESALLFDYLENLISLVVGLADTSDDIFQQILEKIDPVIVFIKEILQFSIDDKKNLTISVTLFNAILDFIYDFSSQSEQFIDSLSTKYELGFDSLYSLTGEIPGFNELTKTYILGIKLQLSESSLTSKDIITAFQNIFNNIKDINIEEVRKGLSPIIDNAKPEEIETVTKSRVKSRSKFQAIELSIELFTAVFEIVAFQQEESSEKGDKFKDDGLSSMLITDIPQVLLGLLIHPEFRVSTLTALNNLSWIFITTNLLQEGWLNKSKEIWDSVLSLAGEHEVEEKISIFGIFWAILIVNLNSIEVSDEFVSSSINELKVTIQSDIESELKEEYVTRLIGVLGSIAKKQGFIERNLVISKFFFELIESLPNNLLTSRVIVEILDIFYEIFGDKAFDYNKTVFVGEGYIDKLTRLTPKIRTSIKLVDRKTNPGLKAKADEVFNNLSRFIKYKKHER